MANEALAPDVFAAIADEQRRRILVLLLPREHAVNDIARHLGIAQPLASKHLKVLKDVGLIEARAAGRQRLYHLKEGALLPVYQWTRQFEALWQERFDRLDELLVELQAKEQSP